MTKFDLFDSIGNVDDELIEKAKQPNKSNKKAIAFIASVAACAVFACAGVLWLNSSGNKDQTAALIAVSETDSNTKRSYVSSSGYYSVNESSGHQGNVSGESGEISEETGFVSESAESYSGSGGIQSSGEYKSESSTAESHVIHGSELSTGGGTSDVSEIAEYSEEPSCPEPFQESSEPLEKLEKEMYIYYSEDGAVKKKRMTVFSYENNVFEAWKSINGIGSEVELINTLHEVGGERITDAGFDLAKATAPGHEKTVTLVLFITDNFENYYTRPDKKLLLQSLEQTMLHAFDITPDEVRIELWDFNKSISYVAEDMYYVDNGKIVKERMFIDSTTTEFFDTWKQKNHIGDEVDFISAYEVDGELLGDPHFTFFFTYYARNKLDEATTPGHKKKLTYIIYISDDIKNYFDRTDPELLLQSLELTMLGACDYPPDEHRVELWDPSQVIGLATDEPISSYFDSEDIRYNDQGEILE